MYSTVNDVFRDRPMNYRSMPSAYVFKAWKEDGLENDGEKGADDLIVEIRPECHEVLQSATVDH